MQVQRRSLSIVPTSFNDEDQSVGIIITTPTPIRTWIPDPSWTGPANQCTYIEGDEVLLASGLDYSRTPGMPLCDGHNTGRVGDVLGNVENVRAEGEDTVGTAVYMPHLSNIYQAVKAGFLRQVSAGYHVNKYVQVERTDGVDVPLFHAVDWTLLEASHVPIGADAGATVRSNITTEFPMPIFQRSATKDQENPMDLENLVADAEDKIMAADAAIQAVVDAKDDGATDELVERANAVRSRATRAEGDDPEKKDDAAAAADEAAATDDEKKDLEEVRAIARSLGLSKIVDDGVKLRAKASDIRDKMRSAYFSKATTSASEKVEPITQGKRNADTTINIRSVYDNLNGRAGAGGARGN